MTTDRTADQRRYRVEGQVQRSGVALLERDPELGEALKGQEVQRAREHLTVNVVTYPAGPWNVSPDDFEHSATLGLLVLEGLIAREVTVGHYKCAELLGPGDVVLPWLRVGPEHSVRSEIEWHAAEPLQLAVLDRDFWARVVPWPEIPSAVACRITQRAHWLSFQLAVCGLRRIDDRLLLVLWRFADRWGTVTPEGVQLNVPLTHDLLAAAVGARRPSVSTGLRRLADEGLIQSRPRSRWLLLGSPPAEAEKLPRRPPLQNSR